jgi:protein phosphatase
VDATNATSGDRRPLLRLAAIARRPAVGIVLDPGLSVCIARNAGRDGRVVQEDVVRRQWAAVRASLADPARLLSEGFAAIHVLDGPAAIQAATVVRDPSIRPVPVEAGEGPVTRRRAAPRARRA